MLKNKRIWITGASRGIGAAITLELEKNGATLALTASQENSFLNLKNKLNSSNKIQYYPCDLSQELEVKNTYNQIKSEFGGIDILINNAGVGIFKPTLDFTCEEIYNIFSVNLFGAFFCSREVLIGNMISEKSGMIINIISVSALKVFKNGGFYGASKAAAALLSQTLREEIRDTGIKIINIYPGATVTDIWEEKVLQKKSDLMMQPEDVAQAVVSIIKLGDSKRLMIEEVILRPQNGDL